MKTLSTFLDWLSTETDKIPPSYGTHHLIYVALFAIGTFVLCYFLKDCTDKTMRRLTLFVWIPFALGEIGNQLIYTHVYGSFQWKFFPFQLCATPIYVMPFIAFMKDCKFRDAIMAFMSTFAFFGGLVVFIYPNDVFCPTVFINHKTMLHHGTQIAMGVFYFVYNRKKVDIKYFLRAIYVFVVLAGVATIMNEIAHAINPNVLFNMFYFSRYFPCHLPILAQINQVVSPTAFIFIYVVGFTAVGLMFQYIMVGIYKLVQKILITKYAKN